MKSYLLPFYLIDEYLLIIRNRIKYILFPHPPAKWNIGKKGDIVLIQGLHESWVFLKTIADVLNTNGYRIHVIKEIETNTLSVLLGLTKVSDYIKKHDLKNITLVTHSKGGLLALYLLKEKTNSLRVKQLISIACPFSGSILAPFFPSSRELHPKSLVIKDASIGVSLAKVFNLHPRLDNHVIPNKNLILKGAINKQIDIMGHTRILESKETVKEILNLMK